MTCVHDLKIGLRQITRHPSYSLVSIVILTLSIGMTAAVFAIIYSVLLAPLPYPDEDRLLVLLEQDSNTGQLLGPSPPNFTDWRQQSRLFERISAVSPGSFVVRREGLPVRVSGLSVTADFDEVLGIRPVAGRTLTEEDSLTGGEPVVVVSHSFWQTHLAEDPEPIGRRIQTTNFSLTVVGVLAPDFYYPDPVDLLVPLRLEQAQLTEAMRGARYLRVLGKLRENTEPVQAAAELEAITGSSPQNEGWSVRTIGLHEHIVGDQRSQLWLLGGAVALLLLIAAANVGGLALSRLAERAGEIHVRVALGAGRRRLVLQLLTEMVILFVVGGLAGLLLAAWSLDVFLSLAPRELPRAGQIGVGGPVLVFTLGLSVLCGALFGLFPALRSTRLQRVDPGGLGGRSPGAASLASRRLLVTAEVALSTVLLVASGLLIRSLINVRSVDPGFEAAETLVFPLALSSSRYDSDVRKAQFFDELCRNIESLQPVLEVGAATNVPLSGSAMTFGFRVPENPDEQQFAQYHSVTPGYLPAMRIRIDSGRNFSSQDRLDSRPVVLVNQTLARQNWPGRDPVGMRIQLSSRTGVTEREIVGVVADVKHSSLDAPSVPEVYVPFAQDPWGFASVAVRLEEISSSTLEDVRRQVWALDGGLPFDRFEFMGQWLARSQAPMRFRAVLLGFFSVLALLLACLGVYGVLSFLVAQRTREIGIRMSLGATRGRLLRSFVAKGSAMVALGVGLGLLASIGLTRLLTVFLFEVEPLDPLSLGAAVTLLLAAAALACYLPARRALRVDPAAALRQE